MEITVKHKEYPQLRIHPLKFALWISLGSISMLFAGLMSAYIVRQAAGNWFEFVLPWHFSISSLIIILSSATAHWCLVSFRKGLWSTYRLALCLTMLLGLLFTFFQYQGWSNMLASGIDLKGNPSGAFVYVITGLHVAHVLGGLSAWIVALIQGLMLPPVKSKTRVTRLELTAQYWHYVDILWLVLFLFLTLYR